MKKDAQQNLTQKKLTLLIQALDSVYPSYKQLLFRSFLQGIFFGLGTTIGVSLIVAVLTYLISSLQIVPGIDYLIEQTQVEQVIDNNFR